MNPTRLTFTIIFLSAVITAQSFRTHPAPGLGDYDMPFVKDGTYLDNIQSPDEFLGFKLGSRPARHPEVRDYFQYLGESLPNAQMHVYGTTYEGRELIYLTVSSEKNMDNLDLIRERNAKLADPRKLKRSENPEKIIAKNPAIAWMGYAIHGDELSSTDAAVQLAYQLLAGTDKTSKKIRDKLVVCIDPLQNPDGRERYLAQLEQWNGVVPNPDMQSLNHTGVWPYGRGNHYLFDLNRDWFATVHPETRGKVSAILDWQPQFLVDAHEMGSGDTYLFNPPRAPFNPYLPKTTLKWWDKFAQDQAAAFDQYGWSYYTRDWNEEFFPGYGSSWGIYIGLVGILYEQSETAGSFVKKLDETTTTYREAIHHQFTSSMANLSTVAWNKKEYLQDYYEHRKENVSRRNASEAFVFPAGDNISRLAHFAETLERQKIEIFITNSDMILPDGKAADGADIKRKELAKGSLIVLVNQPQKSLIQNILSFDLRMDTKSLEKERRELLKNGRGTLYDVTAWSLPLAYGLEAYHTQHLPNISKKPYTPELRAGRLINETARYGFVLSAADDGIYSALSQLFEQDIKLWCAEKLFAIEGSTFPAGSIVILKRANPKLDLKFLKAVARISGVDIIGIQTGLAQEGPDLGGNDFSLLEPPRIALVGGPPSSTYSFGSVWHLLDSRLGTRVSTISAMSLGRADLDKYNVLVLPAMWGGSNSLKNLLGEAGKEALTIWIESGGTLIAEGNAAAFLTDSTVALSSVRQRRQVLDMLSVYSYFLEQLKNAQETAVDSLALWEGITSAKENKDQDHNEKDPPLKELKAADKLGQTLRPRGAILKVDLDQEHWLSFGCGASVPVLYGTGTVFMAKPPIQAAARFAEAGTLRMGGLLWPEARDRIAETAWATRESKGKGQIILFATQPNFRGFFHGSERLLLNALFLGPGMGTSRTEPW